MLPIIIKNYLWGTFFSFIVLTIAWCLFPAVRCNIDENTFHAKFNISNNEPNAPSEPVDLWSYASVNMPFKLAAGYHVFVDFLHKGNNSYAQSFRNDTIVKDPMKLFKLYFGNLDTVKPKPINHRLILTGSDTTFRFLVFAIQNPDDVTKNQKNQLLQWINNSLKQDTTKQK